jgi:hypothetical protein
MIMCSKLICETDDRVRHADMYDVLIASQVDDTPVEDLDVAGVRSLLLGEKGYICGKRSVHTFGPACALTSGSLLLLIPILLPSSTELM